MLADGSDTTSHTNTIELYGPTKETHLYPAAHSDEARSYGTSDRYQEDDYSDDYKSYEVGTRWHVPVWFWSLTLGGQSHHWPSYRLVFNGERQKCLCKSTD